MPEHVTVAVPLDEAFVSVVRIIVSGVAERAELAFEDMDDLQLAVERLLAEAGSEGRASLSFELGTGYVRTLIGPLREHGLAEALARRYAGRGEPLEDLEQVGAIGLLKAIDRFELDRKVSLATYATPNVVGEIKRHFRDKGWAIRVPRAVEELSARMASTIGGVTSRLGRAIVEDIRALSSWSARGTRIAHP